MTILSLRGWRRLVILPGLGTIPLILETILMTLDVKLAIVLTAFFKDDKTNVNEASQIMFLLVDEQMKATGSSPRKAGSRCLMA